MDSAHLLDFLASPFYIHPIILEDEYVLRTYCSFDGLLTLHLRHPDSGNPLFRAPIFSPLLIPNTASTTRDHLANERTFLSWLRLSIYLSIVSIAIILSFHLRTAPTSIEKRIALPLGLIFWVLSLACLGSGAANYAATVVKYERRTALVQSDWKTQVVSFAYRRLTGEEVCDKKLPSTNERRFLPL